MLWDKVIEKRIEALEEKVKNVSSIPNSAPSTTAPFPAPKDTYDSPLFAEKVKSLVPMEDLVDIKSDLANLHTKINANTLNDEFESTKIKFEQTKLNCDTHSNQISKNSDEIQQMKEEIKDLRQRNIKLSEMLSKFLQG